MLRPMLRRIDLVLSSLRPAGKLAHSWQREASANAGWLIAERVLSGLVGVTVTVAVARHLGPTSFGVLSFALSLVMLLGTFWTLGLSGIVVRDLVRFPADEPEVLGTLTALRIGGGVVAFAAAIGLTYVIGTDDVTRVAVVILMAGVLVLYAMDGVDLQLQASVRSRFAVVARTSGLLLAALINLGLILAEAPFLGFVGAAAVEYAAGGVALAFIYTRLGGHIDRWRFSATRATYFLSASWPLILSGVLNAVISPASRTATSSAGRKLRGLHAMLVAGSAKASVSYCCRKLLGPSWIIGSARQP